MASREKRETERTTVISFNTNEARSASSADTRGVEPRRGSNWIMANASVSVVGRHVTIVFVVKKSAQHLHGVRIAIILYSIRDPLEQKQPSSRHHPLSNLQTTEERIQSVIVGQTSNNESKGHEYMTSKWNKLRRNIRRPIPMSTKQP
jgi:hypothetical protein